MRPTYAEINLTAIQDNLKQVRKKIGPKVGIMAVVKANAYGHGMLPVVYSILKHHTAESFGVALVEEGIQLREQEITDPILVFTSPHIEQIDLFLQHDLEFTLCSLPMAKRISERAATLGRTGVVHVKVDTGMGRIGIAPIDVLEFVRRVKGMKNLYLKGLYTHFATSDEKDLSFARTQLKVFRETITKLESHHIRIPCKHCANSGAILQLPDSYFDMVRPGIMMYGYPPSLASKRGVPLKESMSIRSFVGYLKKCKPGTSISYGRRYYTSSSTIIATVPIGYADGINRRLTNTMRALVDGKSYPVVGTICMDQVMLDLGKSTKVQMNDEVIFIGRSGKLKISVWDIAEKLGTIPYEVCCAISERMPRKYIYG